MNTVKVEKSKLLEVVRANRENHKKIFTEAQENYRTAVIAELDRMLAEAKSGARIRRAVSLVEPIDQTREYDSAIRMLEMSTDDVIELTTSQFNNLVLDDWSWRHQFLASNRLYSKTADDIMTAAGAE